MNSQAASTHKDRDMSALAVHNMKQNDDAEYPPSPIMVKKAGDKGVLSQLNVTMDDDKPGQHKEGLFDTVSPKSEKDEEGVPVAPSASHVIQALTKYIT